MHAVYRLLLCCFFFFQAEDGIRDIGVTGVQTCALPICRQCTLPTDVCIVRVPEPPFRSRTQVKALIASRLHHLFDEFDPGSGSTLAACLTHVSRAAALRSSSGGRLRNTYEPALSWGITHRKVC